PRTARYVSVAFSCRGGRSTASLAGVQSPGRSCDRSAFPRRIPRELVTSGDRLVWPSPQGDRERRFSATVVRAGRDSAPVGAVSNAKFQLSAYRSDVLRLGRVLGKHPFGSLVTSARRAANPLDVVQLTGWRTRYPDRSSEPDRG